MTEDQARAWIADRYGAAALDRLSRFVLMLIDETARQNLIAPSTIPSIWIRHIVDSAQLAAFSMETGIWLDIGSGGGLPGIVLALLLDRPFVLCEPRKLRAAFLVHVAERLSLTAQVSVIVSKVENLTVKAATISARAVTGLDQLIRAASGCAKRDTCWILPRGQSGAAEIQTSAMLRYAAFHVEPSLTDPLASILVARGLV